VIVFSPTAQLSKDFDFLDDQTSTKFIVYQGGFKEEFLKLTQRLEELQLAKKAPETLLVVDDLATNPILRQDSVIDKYAIRHRHARLSMMVVGHSLRGVCGLPKSLRSQIDYNILFNPASMTELYTLIKECVFPRDIKTVVLNTEALFSTLYNYMIFEPAAVYERKLVDNRGVSMITSNNHDRAE
jgi:hypothetical protein